MSEFDLDKFIEDAKKKSDKTIDEHYRKTLPLVIISAIAIAIPIAVLVFSIVYFFVPKS